MTTAIVANIIGGISSLLLGGIITLMWRVFRKFNRFMAEHLWLITTTLWTRDKVILIMTELKMPIDNPPPSEIPKRLK